MKDAIIILGCRVNSDGTLPKIAKQRVKKGFELYTQGISKKIIMSGRGGFLSDKTIPKTEAKAMKDYAIFLGIPKNNIYLEEKSKDTIGNAYFVKTKILEPKKWKNISIVTSDFHLKRSKYVFEKVFGKKYKIDYFASKSNLKKEESNKIKESEKTALHLTKKWIEKYKIKGDNSFGEFIFKKHHIYFKNLQISKDHLIKKLTKT